VLGRALVPLRDACDARGAPAPFSVALTRRGVTCAALHTSRRGSSPRDGYSS
jgi:hypothetical protein